MIRNTVNRLLKPLGVRIERSSAPRANRHNLVQPELYQPYFSPWEGLEPFASWLAAAAPRTLVSGDRCYVLCRLAQQAIHLGGEFWECGVYRGGTAAMLARLLDDHGSKATLRLFDTFGGMPETDAVLDQHKAGDFSDTSLESVREFVGHPEKCAFHPGFIPDTFAGLEDRRIAFAHVDVDIHQAILDCCTFIWPRLVPGGFLIFDDYGIYTCPGARRAVDAFFAFEKSLPLTLPTGQAVIFKSPASD